MKRILLIPGYRLFPIETGAGVAQYGIIDELRKYMKVSLLLNEANVTTDSLEELRARWPEVGFLHWKRLKADWEKNYQPSFSSRLKRKLGLERDKIETPKVNLPEELNEAWENSAILYYAESDWRKKSLQYFLTKEKFDIVQTDLPVNIQLIGKKVPGLRTVHVCHELKHKRFGNSARFKRVPEDKFIATEKKLKSRERELISAYDQCVVFSKEDAILFEGLPRTRISISPFPILDEDFFIGQRSMPKRLLFLGPEVHGPNKEGLTWFINEVFCGLDENWKLHVVGKWSQSYISEHGSERVIFEGFVEQLETFFSDSVMIVPIKSGAGIRTKIIQAMAAKVPLLSTPFAAEGLMAKEGKEILYFEDAAEFRIQLERLGVKEFTREITEGAQKLAKNRFSQATLGKLRYDILSQSLR